QLGPHRLSWTLRRGHRAPCCSELLQPRHGGCPRCTRKPGGGRRHLLQPLPRLWVEASDRAASHHEVMVWTKWMDDLVRRSRPKTSGPSGMVIHFDGIKVSTRRVA